MAVALALVWSNTPGAAEAEAATAATADSTAATLRDVVQRIAHHVLQLPIVELALFSSRGTCFKSKNDNEEVQALLARELAPQPTDAPATPAVLNAIQYAQLGKAPTHVIVVGNALAAVHGHLTAAAVPLSTVRLQVVVVSHTPADSEAQVQMAAAVHKICHNSGGLYITLGAGTAPKALAQSLQPLLEQQLALPSAGLELGDTRTAVYLFPAPHLISAATPFSARHTSATIRILAFVGEEEDTKIKAALQLDAVPVIAWSTALLVPIAAATPGPSSLLYRALALALLESNKYAVLDIEGEPAILVASTAHDEAMGTLIVQGLADRRQAWWLAHKEQTEAAAEVPLPAAISYGSNFKDERWSHALNAQQLHSEVNRVLKYLNHLSSHSAELQAQVRRLHHIFRTYGMSSAIEELAQMLEQEMDELASRQRSSASRYSEVLATLIEELRS